MNRIAVFPCALVLVSVAACGGGGAAAPASSAVASPTVDRVAEVAAIVEECNAEPGFNFVDKPSATSTGFSATVSTKWGLASVMCILDGLGMPPDMKIKLDATNEGMGAQDYSDATAGIDYTWSYSTGNGLAIVAVLK